MFVLKIGLVINGHTLASWRCLGRIGLVFIDIFPSGSRRGGYNMCMMGRYSGSEWNSNNVVTPL